MNMNTAFKHSAIIALAIVTMCVWAGAPDAAEELAVSHPVIHTDKGDVKGAGFADHREFLGIPFAAPPVDNLRFAPPREAEPWSGAREALKFSANCPQNKGPIGAMASNNEDCLYLNVYTPAKAGKHLPVFFWIYGGGFFYGGAGSPLYRGVNLSRKGVIVVTANYRLNAFGFLAASALSKRAPNHVSGNYGIEDQQAALRWVQRNIANFGGDPRKVTIAGESAGASSVADHLLSPQSGGLFRGAIGESTIGVRSGLSQLPTLAEAEAIGDRYVATVGCTKQPDPVQCLRSISVDTLLAKMIPPGPGGPGGGGLRWTPNLDGVVLTRQPAEAFAGGQFNKVPVINGTNRTESEFFSLRDDPGFAPVDKSHPFDASGYADRIRQRFHANSGEILERYPADKFSSPLEAWTVVQTDSGFSCPASRATKALASHVPVWEYEFAEDNPAFPIPHPTGYPWHDPHAVELSYVFGNFAPNGVTPANRALSGVMITYWTNFVKTLNPNAKGSGNSADWAVYQAGSDNVLSLDDQVAVSHEFRRNHNCDFWDTAR